MSRQISHILQLSDTLSGHLGVSHWSISMQIAGKGDLLKRLKEGGDLRTRVAERTFTRLAAIWPEDLEWPADIPRPETEVRRAS